jgi:hypothetical protein
MERLRFAIDNLPGILAGFTEAESEARPSPERCLDHIAFRQASSSLVQLRLMLSTPVAPISL